jgi:hypothetical protein
MTRKERNGEKDKTGKRGGEGARGGRRREREDNCGVKTRGFDKNGGPA